MNERDALIAAVRAQVEKEKAAKAEKLAKEQEMQNKISGKSAQTQSTQKFRPWNPDDNKKKEEKAAEDKKPEQQPNPASKEDKKEEQPKKA